jgi:DNA-binding NarL/FixJ family response regulator
LAHIALVRIQLIRREYDDAQHTIKHLENTWPACGSLAETLRIQNNLTQLDKNSTVPDTALGWMQAHQPVLADDKNIPGINPWGETFHLKHLTWVQIQIAQARSKPLTSRKPYLQPVLEYLERRLDIAWQRDLIFRVIEMSVVQALALEAVGDVDRATTSLQEALNLAQAERYVRVFIDKGAPMDRLLKLVSEGGQIPSYAGEMLVAYEDQSVVGDHSQTPRHVEPLSERELEVLRLIAAGRSNREIALELTLALGTVKKHINNIFGKLHVHSRTQAVAQARELKLM